MGLRFRLLHVADLCQWLGSVPPKAQPLFSVVDTPHASRSGCTWARATAPSPGQPTPGVVKQDKSSGGFVDTTKTRSHPQSVGMSGGERPMGAARGKQSDTEALCLLELAPAQEVALGLWSESLGHLEGVLWVVVQPRHFPGAHVTALSTTPRTLTACTFGFIYMIH